MTLVLPPEFADLEPFADWCLPTEAERYAKRLASSMEEMQAFYDAAFPRLDQMTAYLDARRPRLAPGRRPATPAPGLLPGERLVSRSRCGARPASRTVVRRAWTPSSSRLSEPTRYSRADRCDGGPGTGPLRDQGRTPPVGRPVGGGRRAGPHLDTPDTRRLRCTDGRRDHRFGDLEDRDRHGGGPDPAPPPHCARPSGALHPGRVQGQADPRARRVAPLDHRRDAGDSVRAPRRHHACLPRCAGRRVGRAGDGRRRERSCSGSTLRSTSPTSDQPR